MDRHTNLDLTDVNDVNVGSTGSIAPVILQSCTPSLRSLHCFQPFPALWAL